MNDPYLDALDEEDNLDLYVYYDSKGNIHLQHIDDNNDETEPVIKTDEDNFLQIHALHENLLNYCQEHSLSILDNNNSFVEFYKLFY